MLDMMRHGKFDNLVARIGKVRSKFLFDASEKAWAFVLDSVIDYGFFRLMKGATGGDDSANVCVQVRKLCIQLGKVSSHLDPSTAADIEQIRTAALAVLVS